MKQEATEKCTPDCLNSVNKLFADDLKVIVDANDISTTQGMLYNEIATVGKIVDVEI